MRDMVARHVETRAWIPRIRQWTKEVDPIGVATGRLSLGQEDHSGPTTAIDSYRARNFIKSLYILRSIVRILKFQLLSMKQC